MIRLRNNSENRQIRYVKENIDKLGQCFYVHYDAYSRTLAIRGVHGILTLNIDSSEQCLDHRTRRKNRIAHVLEHFGASEGGRKVLVETKPSLSWLYTLGRHRHVKIAKHERFRFWPSDIKKIVGIEGTYASA